VLIERDALDHAFIDAHTHGFDPFAAAVRDTGWDQIERLSGLTRNAITAAAMVYARANRTIGIYGMGLTQHRLGVQTVQMLVNLLLLRGNIGKPGAGVCPVRGHSNVQGQRTVGITEKPELVPMDRLRDQYGFEPPTEKGLNTVEACEAILGGKVRAFIGLGGNFLRAVPERNAMEDAWRKLRLTVQIATKPNHGQVLHGEIAYILPCLGRIEADRQQGRLQSVSVEDSTACIHGSKGLRAPADPMLRSEAWIVAQLAKALLPANPRVDWDGWCGDYARVRDAIEATYPEQFRDFNRRMWQPGGFHRPIPARDRVWKTKTGKANFVTPSGLATDPDMPAAGGDVLTMMTLRSNGQFNTTIYSQDDRFRGIHGTRMVLLINRNDADRLGLSEGMVVGLETIAGDGVRRAMAGFRVTVYDIPEGCVGTYYPEANALIPLWHHAERSKVPAAKSIPVRVVTEAVYPSARGTHGMLATSMPSSARDSASSGVVSP
jgi:molybdopterin-dependent oxidoreductase alpha subunit